MKNWKTTLVGIIAGTLTILQTTLTAYQSGEPVQWLQVALGIALMAFGVVCKDFNVTGTGTATPATKTALTLLCVFALISCAALVPAVLTAKSSDSKDWPVCLEWSQDAGLKTWELVCGDATMTLPKLQAQVLDTHPKATIREVSR